MLSYIGAVLSGLLWSPQPAVRQESPVQIYDSLGRFEKFPYLNTACEKGKIDIVTSIIDKYPEDASTRNLYGNKIILHSAIQSGNFELVQYLVAKGAIIESYDNKKASSIFRAAAWNQHVILNYLLKQCFQTKPRTKRTFINEPKENNFSPLMAAIYCNSQKSFDVLLRHKADINRQYHNGHTALTWATVHGRKEMVKKLLKKGARTDITINNEDRSDITTNNERRSALTIAQERNFTDIIQILESYSERS